MNPPATARTARQAVTSTDQPSTAFQDMLGRAVPQRRGNQAGDLQDIEESDDEPDTRKKRTRDNAAIESWIEGFHTGADAALKQTLSS